MNKILNLQDVFLNQARKDKIPVTIYLTNGFQFKGMVRGCLLYTSEKTADLMKEHLCAEFRITAVKYTCLLYTSRCV